MDEVLRLKQITGLKEAFSNHEFSKSWEEFEKNTINNRKGLPIECKWQSFYF